MNGKRRLGRTLVLSAALLGATMSAHAKPAYDQFANPEFIVSVDQLQAALEDPNLVLIDARSEEDYRASHIPGAVSLPAVSLDRVIRLENGNEVRRMVKQPDQIREHYAEAGINTDSRVVIYDVGGSSLATRVWWTLDYYGHRNIAVLDGGLTAWEAAGKPVTTQVSRARTGGNFRPVPDASKIADFDYVKARLGTEATAVCNALSEESHAEEAIPSSINLPRTFTVSEANKTPLLKEATALRATFLSLDMRADKEIIFYCGAGYAASQDYFVARLLGYTNVRNYDGSKLDWKARGGELSPGGRS